MHTDLQRPMQAGTFTQWVRRTERSEVALLLSAEQESPSICVHSCAFVVLYCRIQAHRLLLSWRLGRSTIRRSSLRGCRRLGCGCPPHYRKWRPWTSAPLSEMAAVDVRPTVGAHRSLRSPCCTSDKWLARRGAERQRGSIFCDPCKLCARMVRAVLPLTSTPAGQARASRKTRSGRAHQGPVRVGLRIRTALPSQERRVCR